MPLSFFQEVDSVIHGEPFPNHGYWYVFNAWESRHERPWVTGIAALAATLKCRWTRQPQEIIEIVYDVLSFTPNCLLTRRGNSYVALALCTSLCNYGQILKRRVFELRMKKVFLTQALATTRTQHPALSRVSWQEDDAKNWSHGLYTVHITQWIRTHKIRMT